MGLDMYLTISEYVARTKRDELRPDKPKDNPLFQELVNRRPTWVDKGAFQGISVEYPACQWRKANGIHGWFVQNVQDGRDECQRSYVSPEKLRDLRYACEQVLREFDKKDGNVQEVAEQVGLAPKSGFFFGSQEYDGWYMRDIQYTVKRINQLEASGVFDNAWVDIYYQASW